MNKDKLVAKILVGYSNIVMKTSKITYINEDYLTESEQKYLAVFWHEFSYCLIPTMTHERLGVITTTNQRGSYISEMCKLYGYKPLRLPDETQRGNPLFKMVRDVNKDKTFHVALATDGPIGPYRIPKDFTFVLAEMLHRDILPVTIDVKRKVCLFKRWDKYKIPLPFSKITITFNQPLSVSKTDRVENYQTISNNLTNIMNK